MKPRTVSGLAVAAALAAGAAQAEGRLNIYAWTDYISPEVIDKFEAETGIEVTLDTYDTNETLLAKMQAGATGYDIISPSNNFIPIYIAEGLVQEVDATAMPNFQNVDERWRNPEWDLEQKYTVPFHLGSDSIAYRADLYDGEIASLQAFFEPAEELRGRISVYGTAFGVVNLAHLYLGQDFCSEDPAEMQKVQDLLMAQKPYVLTYNSEGVNDRLLNGDVIIASHWNGPAYKGRLLAEEAGKELVYAYPEEGVLGWMDGLMIPASAENVENAKIFMNFMMDPENIGMNSNYAGYGNAVRGSEEFMTESMRSAPEINPPEDAKFVFYTACSPEAQALIDQVWTNLMR